MMLAVPVRPRQSPRHDLARHDGLSLLASWLWLVLFLSIGNNNHSIVVVHARAILVTGGAGFVGSHLAGALLARGDDVVIIDEVNDYYDVKIKENNLQLLLQQQQTENNNNNKNVTLTIYRGDICNHTFLDHVFTQHLFDDIAHMAARAGVRPSIIDPFIYVHSNIKATIALLDRAVRYNITNFVFASSSSVYGGSKSIHFSESEQVDHPISPYASTKKSCELFAYVYHRRFKINTAALRFFTVYGPRGRPDMAVWKFIDRVSNGKVIQQYGDGSSSRDYTYVADIVNGIVRALDRPLGYRIYNLGKGSGTSLHELMGMVETYIGKKAIIEVLPDQPGDVPYTCANVSIAQRDLGYNASFPTNVGVAKTVEWFLATYPPKSATTAVVSAATSATAAAGLWRRRLFRSARVEESLQTNAWLVDEIYDEKDRLLGQGPMSRRKLLSSSTVGRNDDRKTVLVTGGTRFLGSHVVDALLDRGDRVVLVDQTELTDQNRYNLNLMLQQYGESGRVMVHLGDLTDADFLRAVFDMEAPQWVCHVAGSVEDSLSYTESIKIVEQNVDPTLHLLDLSKGKRHGGYDVENFVIVGSAKVYGDRTKATDHHGQSVLLDEEDRVDAPLTPYAASKKSEELLAYTYHHLYSIPISVLRVDTMFGPRHDLNSQSFAQFHRFLQNATTTTTLSLSAESSEPPDVALDDNWVYVGDVVTALLSALDHQHDYDIFNVGGRNCPQTLDSVFRTMDTLFLGVGAGDTFPPRQRQPCLSMEKTKQKLQFKPSVTLLEGVMETIQWHRDLFDYSRISSLVNTANPFTMGRRSNRINSYGSVVHSYPGAGPMKVKRQGWGLLRDIACLQWAIVVMVVLYRSFNQHNNRNRRGRSPSPV